MNDTIEKINSRIQYSLSFIIRDILPDDMFSITDVSTDKDLGNSRISIAPLKNHDRFMLKLEKSTSKIRHIMARSINLKKTPNLFFILDKSSENFDKIEKLIGEDSKLQKD